MAQTTIVEALLAVVIAQVYTYFLFYVCLGFFYVVYVCFLVSMEIVRNVYV